jgi:hypothetical protein
MFDSALVSFAAIQKPRCEPQIFNRVTPRLNRPCFAGVVVGGSRTP